MTEKDYHLLRKRFGVEHVKLPKESCRNCSYNASCKKDLTYRCKSYVGVK